MCRLVAEAVWAELKQRSCSPPNAICRYLSSHAWKGHSQLWHSVRKSSEDTELWHMELVLHRPKDLEMLLLLLFILFMNSFALVLCASVVSELNPKHWLPFKKTWRNDNLRWFVSAVYLFSVWWGFVRNYESVWTHFGSECGRWSHMYTNTTPCVNIHMESYSLYTPLQHSRLFLLRLSVSALRCGLWQCCGTVVVGEVWRWWTIPAFQWLCVLCCQTAGALW